MTSKIKTYIKNKLKKDWSPKQIAGRMKLDIGLVSVMKPSIVIFTTINQEVVDSTNIYVTRIRNTITDLTNTNVEGLSLIESPSINVLKSLRERTV
jgi:IS30 family transposase